MPARSGSGGNSRSGWRDSGGSWPAEVTRPSSVTAQSGAISTLPGRRPVAPARNFRCRRPAFVATLSPMRTMARQLNARRTGSRGSATARLLAAAGLVALLGGMLAIIMSAREDDAVPPAAVKTTAATPATKPVGQATPCCDRDQGHRRRRLRPRGRQVRERRRRPARDRRQREDGVEDRALPLDVPQVRRRPRARRRQAGEGVARRRHDGDPGLRGAGAGRQLARPARSAPCRDRRRRPRERPSR